VEPRVYSGNSQQLFPFPVNAHSGGRAASCIARNRSTRSGLKTHRHQRRTPRSAAGSRLPVRIFQSQHVHQQQQVLAPERVLCEPVHHEQPLHEPENWVGEGFRSNVATGGQDPDGSKGPDVHGHHQLSIQFTIRQQLFRHD